MENKHIYIHIGYPKTATTTLQNHLFSKHDGIDYLHDQDLGEISQIIFYGRENAILRNKQYINKKLDAILAKYADSENDIVLSSESLTSFSMFFRFTPNPFIWAPDPTSIARKLCMIFLDSKLFTNVKILVSIRRQDLLIKSMYPQVYNLVFKRFQQTNNFRNFLRYILDENSDHFMIDSLHYEDVIRSYIDLFGHENVNIQVFEELKYHPEQYIKKLADYLHIEHNTAYQCLKSKNLNQRSGEKGYYPSDNRNLVELLSIYKKRWFGERSFNLKQTVIYDMLKKTYIPGRKLKDIYIPDKYIDKLNDEFSLSNRYLSETYGLNLDVYKYLNFPYETA